MPTYEGLRLKLLKFRRLGFANYRKAKLKSTDFTIISNNCWGGMIYESYGLPKESPTIGLFFMAHDYVEFLSDLKGYLKCPLTFIDPEKSKWKNSPQLMNDKRYGSYPVGILSNGKDTIELFFLHYHSEDEAKEKWERRIERINWDKLLVKFNDQNGCSEKDVDRFMNLDIKNKVFFTCKSWPNQNRENYILIKQFPKRDFIFASFEPFGRNKYLDITKLLNSL